MKLSARNQLAGKVVAVQKGATTAHVRIDIGGGKTLAATITAQSAKDLSLAQGKPVCALFDAAHVIIAID